MVKTATRGGREELLKINAKTAEKKSISIKCFQEGKYFRTFTSIQEAARSLHVNPGGIDRCLKNPGNKIGRVYSFEFEEQQETEGEIWKPLPSKLPEWILARRLSGHALNFTPGPTWKKYEVSNLGRIRRGPQGKVGVGSEGDQGYYSKRIEDVPWKIAHLVALAFGLSVRPGDEIDHIDNDRSNNRLDNLQPLDKKEHAKKTPHRTPETIQKLAESKSRLFHVISSTRHPELVGKDILSCHLWPKLGLKGSIALINCATKNDGQANPVATTGGCVVIHAKQDVLLEGEYEIPGNILIDGQLEPYVVTNFGRFKRRQTLSFVNKVGQVGIAGKQRLISHLVLLAKEGLTEVPYRGGELLTADHIHGRDHEFPNRIENLRWATKAEQMANRCAHGEEPEEESDDGAAGEEQLPDERGDVVGSSSDAEMEDETVAAGASASSSA